MAISVEGFESSQVFTQISEGLASSQANKEAAIKKVFYILIQVKAVFQFDVKNKDNKVQQWTLDLKNKGSVSLGPSTPKADIIIAVQDSDFINLAGGKLNGQKAFMTGKIKIKGNMMLATSKHLSNKRVGLCPEISGTKSKALINRNFIDK